MKEIMTILIVGVAAIVIFAAGFVVGSLFTRRNLKKVNAVVDAYDAVTDKK